MANGHGGARPGGGRPKGSPSKTTLDVHKKLADRGIDPIMMMAEMAIDTSNSVELRAKLVCELAQYVAPKRKAVDHTSTDGSVNTGPQEIVVRVVRPTLTVVGSDAA